MKKGKKPISPTRYPKKTPLYVVALATQETLDDPQNLQFITDKRSSENNTLNVKPMSPTDSLNSTKTFTVTPTEKLSLNEVRIDILDENQCGDILDNKSPQISRYIEIDKMTADEQPKGMCNAPKHIKKCKNTNRFPRKKPWKSKRVIILKNIHFKYKKPKNGITRRLEKYYEKTKLNTPNAEEIQNQICTNVLSTVVSRSQIIKELLPKENIIPNSGRNSPNDNISMFEFDGNSINSSPSTIKKSFTSYTSQNTLVRKDSPSSINEDFNSIKAADVVINVPTENTSPYKFEIINVSLASADKSKINSDQTENNSNDKLTHNENLTSSVTVLQTNELTNELTSQPPSSEEPKSYFIDYDDMCPVNLNSKVESNATITQEAKSLTGVSSDDNTFVIAQLSSEFNKSSMNSDCTLSFNSETKLNTENVPSISSIDVDLSNDNSEKTTLLVDRSSFFKILDWLKKLKTLGYYPIRTPCIGSGTNLNSAMNDVLVTNNIRNSLPLISKHIKEDIAPDTNKTTVLKKPVEVKLNDLNYLQNNISLPNDVTIKADLKEVQEDTRSEKVKSTYPTDLGEMWERLTLVLDLAVKRLEETLADRIVKDLRASLTIFQQADYKEPTIEVQRADTSIVPVRCERPIPTMLHKGIFVLEDHFKRYVDMCVQCDLLPKQVIDQLMFKLSGDAPKPIPPSVEALKVLQPPEILKDYVDILKPRVAQAVDSVSIEVGKADTVTVSTATTKLSLKGFSRFKCLYTAPIDFFRANMIILTSVPTFFLVLFCLYGVIVIVMKP